MAIPSPQVIAAVDTISDQRLDIDGTVWQLSTNTNESVILYGITDNAGNNYEIGYFKERPAALNFYGSNLAPAVSGETEVTTLGAITASPATFYVDYDRAFILFPNGHGTPASVTYKGMGSIQKAIDINESIKTANSATLAEEWASKDTSAVASSLFSAKEYASGTSATGGTAKEWATNAGSAEVHGGAGYSAKAYAQNTGNNIGSAKDWAILATQVTSADYSSKQYAVGTPPDGSAKEWAKTTGAIVADSEYSAKEYALGTTVAAGSAKDWAILPENSVVDGGSGYSALHWAAKAATSFDDFDDRYLGAKSSAPSVDNDGQTLLTGATYFNSSESAMYVRTSSATWVLGTPVAPLSMIVYKYIATASQTSFSGSDANSATLSYTANNITVYLNGVRLDTSDYTATNGTAVVLGSGATVADELVVIAFKAFATAAFVEAAGGTFSGAVTFGAGLTTTTADINGGTLAAITIDGAWTAASQTCANLGSVTTCDINGGTIDGVTSFNGATIKASNDEATFFIGNSNIPTPTEIDGSSIQNEGRNTGMGHDIMEELTSGGWNSSFGYHALKRLTSGYGNVAFGILAAQSINTSYYNVASGAESLVQCTSGNSNTACGYHALPSVTTGSNNIGIGAGSGGADSPSGLIFGGSNQLCMGNDTITHTFVEIDWTVGSDGRDKTDVEDFTAGLDFVNKMRPITYRWDKRSWYTEYDDETGEIISESTPDGTHKKEKQSVGFISQDIEILEKEIGFASNENNQLFCNTVGDGTKIGLRYATFVPLLVNAIKELSTKVKALEAA